MRSGRFTRMHAIASAYLLSLNEICIGKSLRIVFLLVYIGMIDVHSLVTDLSKAVPIMRLNT